jgi:hypothetical protein
VSRGAARAVPVALFAVAIAALVAGCTSSTSGTAAHNTSLTPVPTTSAVSDTPTDTATGTAPPPTVSSTAAATSPTSSPTIKLPADNCPTSQLRVRVILGSGAQQQEFAEIDFVNTGTTECSLTGYPGVSLRVGGAALSTPARTDPTSKVATIHLAPDAVAKAMLTDFSSCNAPLSDTVRVSPPGSKDVIDRPGELRGCQLVVGAVTAA